MLGGEKERQSPIARITPQEVEASVSPSPEPPAVPVLFSPESSRLVLAVTRPNFLQFSLFFLENLRLAY
jgi:hypothetical protein